MSDRSSEQRATEGSDRVREMSLEDAFDEPAFVPYLAAGDPTYDASLAYVEALERGGADVVELGLPFSEPMAEGTSIQDAVTRALDAGMTPDRYFEFCEEVDVDVPLVCMTYYNLVHRYGADDPDADRPAAFVERAAEAGIDGFVVPDLPAEEADPLRAACDDAGLDLVFIVAPTTTDERLARILDRVSGYLYVQARLGVTGARDDLSDRTAESLARLEGTEVPKAVGFGIKTGAHARAVVEAGADGVIVGSALVDRVAAGVDAGTPTDEVAAQLEAMARELKEGALAGGAQRAPGPERT